MLYVIHGVDHRKAHDKTRSLIGSLRTKRPDAAFVRIDADAWHSRAIEEHLGGQGLFSNKYVVYLDRVTEHAEAKEALADLVPAMQESANIFIVLECKLAAELKKACEKHAEKMVECASEADAAKGKRDEFNIFALTDAFGSRDTFKAWMLYRQAVENGLEPENIAGTLFWQVKSMMLAVGAKSAGEAGLSPFVYGKSKRAAASYSPEEMRRLSAEIVSSYHDAHRGHVDLELRLERLLLGL